MKAFILCTCRSPELLRMTTLVFETLRIGFPTASVFVTGNALHDYAREAVTDFCKSADCEFVNGEETIHHDWINRLIAEQSEPFYLVDTDMVFYSSVEGWKFDTALAGWRIPEWKDEFSNCITRSRLHTSLLYIDPARVRNGMESFKASRPSTDFTPAINLINPIVQPLKGMNYFSDTCSLLYHAIGGTPFTDEQKDAYFHFNFGTIADVVMPRLKDAPAFTKAREEVLKDLNFGRGRWRDQERYYESRPAIVESRDVIQPVSQKDAEDYRKVNEWLCRNDRDAMLFCDLWYNYCHGIDDLVDTIEDGRPVMGKEQIISLFLKAAMLYNSRFYQSHQTLLFPIVVQITNTYADSVAWEKDPKAHLRAMADVFRTCGNEMYVMVALACGGESHMREFSKFVKERDWLGQHDENGKPT